MKKNVSLLQSLTLVVLIAPSCVLGMDETKTMPTPADRRNAKKNKQGNRTPLAVSSDTIPAEHAIVPVRKDSLAESVMVTPTPTTRGFGLLRSLKDCAWSAEENLFADLENKTFDVKNSSYHRKLDTAIEQFVVGKNNKRITETLALCRQDHYRSHIKIGDMPTRMAHEFLVQENKTKQAELKKALETKDALFIQTQNMLLKTLQSSIKTQIEAIGTELDKHVLERDTLVKKEGDEIRRLKTGLVHTHKLNKTFALLESDYCSDEETDADNVKHSYNDKYLLAKIAVDDSIAATTTKTTAMLERLININKELQSIRQLQYEQRDL